MTAVVKDILEHHPEYKDVLAERGVTDVKSPTARAYMVRIVHQFDNLINLLDDPLVLVAQLDFLKEQYTMKKGDKSYFEALSDAMERVLPETASCFPTAAWNRCFARLAHSIEDSDDD
jgi:hypothetical protein